MAVKLPNTAKQRGKGKPFAKGDDPRRNLAGRPKGATLKEALKAWLATEQPDGATHAGAIAESLVQRSLKGDQEALNLIVLLTEERMADGHGTAKLLISVDR